VHQTCACCGFPHLPCPFPTYPGSNPGSFPITIFSLTNQEILCMWHELCTHHTLQPQNSNFSLSYWFATHSIIWGDDATRRSGTEAMFELQVIRICYAAHTEFLLMFGKQVLGLKVHVALAAPKHASHRRWVDHHVGLVHPRWLSPCHHTPPLALTLTTRYTSVTLQSL